METMKKEKAKSDVKIVMTVLGFIAGIDILIVGSIIALAKFIKPEEAVEDEWILRKTATDEFGYGETNVGSSGLYVYTTRPLLDSAGCTENSNVSRMTDWELTIVVDSVQQTEYLIFKDTTTGNIAAVERRKYEEVIPEEEKIYLDN